MKKWIASLVAVLFLTCFVLPQTGSTPKAGKSGSAPKSTTAEPKVMKFKGVIVSSTDDSLVAAKKANDKNPMTFSVNSTTVKPASLNNGGKVSVWYTVKDGQKVATKIEAQSATPKAAPKTTTKP